MRWLLIAAACVLIVGLATIIVNAASESGSWFKRRNRGWQLAKFQPRCLPCQGTGWIGREPERTLNFVGDGFEDRYRPAVMCSNCGGTGRLPER